MHAPNGADGRDLGESVADDPFNIPLGQNDDKARQVQRFQRAFGQLIRICEGTDGDDRTDPRIAGRLEQGRATTH